MTNKQQTTATIYDIAKLAGVNPSTVSRALNNPGRINSKTEAKIKDAAKQLNYRVNPFARALPTGKTKMIGLMLTDITNPVFFNAVRGAEDAALRHGYTLVISESQESTALETSTIQKVQAAVDGMVMVTTRLEDDQLRDLNEHKPVVLMNRVVKGISDVVPQIEPGIIEAIEHLASLGHKRLAYISGPKNSWMNNTRWKLLMKHAVSSGMNIVEIGPNNPSLDAGRETFERVQAAGVTAVIAYNDLMAIGFMQEAVSRGVSIPKDLSIVGFDNIFGSDFTYPSLTTVAMPLTQTGDLAIETILTLINKLDQTVKPANELKTSLILRNSTGVAKK